MQQNIRIIHKHAVESTWNTKTEFIPYKGEFIVYDPDDNYSYARVKIGDGQTLINSLPFLKSESADRLTNSRIIRLEGFVTGEVDFNGSKNVTLTTSLAAPITAEFVGKESAHSHMFLGSESTGTAEYTPEGSVTLPYTPAGTITKPEAHVTTDPITETVVIGRDHPSEYVPAEYVAPSFSTRCEDTTLVVEFNAGSYTPAQYIPEGDLTTKSVTWLQSVSVDVDAPEFQGTFIEASGQLKGTTATIISKFIPDGTIQDTRVTPQGDINIKINNEGQ